MPSRPMFVFISAVTACNYDSVLTASSRCDATKQSDEEYVDSPFDADGDGFFDGSNPDCQATYDASALDCDDRDPDVHPEATETLCNGLDDDCDGEIDEDCGGTEASKALTDGCGCDQSGSGIGWMAFILPVLAARRRLGAPCKASE